MFVRLVDYRLASGDHGAGVVFGNINSYDPAGIFSLSNNSDHTPLAVLCYSNAAE